MFGCSKPEQPIGCDRPQPPFRLELTAEKGPLPRDTHLVVRYQGKVGYTEDFDVLHPPTENHDVCCRVGNPVTGKLPSVPCGYVSPRADASAPRDGSSSQAPSHEGGPASQDAAASEAGGAEADVAARREPGDSGANDAGGSPEALLCELWTNGPAQILVVGANYPKIDRELTPDPNPCAAAAFVTKDVHIIWSHRDGGE